jgi:GTPase SAR1 family protein
MTTTITSTETYEEVAAQRSVISALALRLQGAAQTIDARERYDELQRLRERLDTDRLRIMCVGEFKRGKSTLINSMLGRKVLPAWATPTTAIISEVRYGASPAAALYHLDDPVTPIPVDVMHLDEFVTIKEEDDSQNPYSRVEIQWPLPLCERGVSIVDSPGLNEDPRREEITLGYLQSADVLVFVFDCTAALGLSERLFLETRALTSGASDIFFVGNKINHVDEQEERDRVQRVVTNRITNLVGATDRIYFVNAKGALDGRIRGTEIGETGVPRLEASLERYLSDQPARRRLAGAVRLVQYAAEDLTRSVEHSRLLLAQDRDMLRRRYEEQREPLEALERQRDLILSKLRAHVLETLQSVEDMMRAELNDIALKVPAWAEDFTPGTKLRMVPWKIKQQLDGRIEEIVEHLGAEVQREFARWQGQVLKPFLEAKMGMVEAEVGAGIDAFFGQLEEIRCELTIGSSDLDVTGEGASVGGGERIAATIAGFFLTGGSAVEGSMFGFKGLGRSLLATFGVALGLALLNFGPQAILIGMVSAGFLRGFIKLDKVNKKVKDDVAAQVAEHVRSNAPSQAELAAKKVEQDLADVELRIEALLDDRILELQREVENVLADHDRSEQEVAARHAELTAAIDDLRCVEAEARNVFDALVGI